MLQIEAEDLVDVPIGDSEQLLVGDFVVAIGNPFGLGQTVTSGIVSALGRSGINPEGYEDFIQTDASINPGNSGGALITLDGKLVGINTAIIAPNGGGNVGIGFAVPINMALGVMDQLVEFGEVQRGFGKVWRGFDEVRRMISMSPDPVHAFPVLNQNDHTKRHLPKHDQCGHALTRYLCS